MRILLLLTFISFFMNAHAQPESDPFGTEYNFDTASYSDSSSSYEEYESTTTRPDQPDLTPTTFKKYERFKPPMDTITDLVTYTGIVPFKPLENDVYDGGTIDSLYWRAKIYLMKKYLKDYKQSKNPKDNIFPKEILIEDFKPDGENGRVIIRPTVPLYISTNSSTRTQLGTISFKIEIRVKEDKYKYKFTNFVHNTVEKGTEKPIKTYVEYYANTTRGYKGTDQVLISIDRMVKEVVKELSGIMKDPIVLDPDDF
ncbi:MAG: DUF4468 domain-containing protein [Bacteroidia bacterium]|nr:DUF4468 domain-containing protein [Bacteroidia bacterium]